MTWGPCDMQFLGIMGESHYLGWWKTSGKCQISFSMQELHKPGLCQSMGLEEGRQDNPFQRDFP